MEYHAAHETWDDYYGTKRHGRYFWYKNMASTEYIQNWYRATKGRETKVFRPSKSRDKK
jgi:hypothetical protein